MFGGGVSVSVAVSLLDRGLKVCLCGVFTYVLVSTTALPLASAFGHGVSEYDCGRCSGRRWPLPATAEAASRYEDPTQVASWWRMVRLKKAPQAQDPCSIIDRAPAVARVVHEPQPVQEAEATSPN